jgi:pyrroline-5-carboxylate reductase
MASRKIAVLGAGKAGEALIAGLLSSGWRKPSEIAATARHEERLTELSERHGIETTLSNVDAAAGAGIVVIAVKPQDIESLLSDVGSTFTKEQTVITIAAAIPTSLIEGRLGDGVPVVRAMPNTPVTVHEGMSGISAGTHAAEEHLKTTEDVLGSVGRSVRVDEGYMDAITAVSGSREIATDLVVQTMLGTAKLLRDEHMHPVELREMVTSPGGTTIAAIRELEQAGVRAAFLNAIQAAMKRSKELAEGG